jgi:uncharacterized protein involved in outer membrane biogenesis
MKKALLALAALVLLAVLGVAGYGAHLVGRLNTPEFRKELLAQASAAAGSEVRAKGMDISLLSGVTMRGIAVANPTPFPGDLLTAEAFVLRYRLAPLLAGRVEVQRLALEKPTLGLVVDAKGGLNYEKLGRPAARSAPAPGAATPASLAAPLRVVLKALAVENGSILMTDATKARLMKVDGIDFRSAFELAGGVAQGQGEVQVGSASFGDMLFVRQVRAPLRMSKETVTLAPLRAQVAGGEATGDVTVQLKGGFSYVAHLAVKGARVKTLLEEAGSAALVSGTLAAKAAYQGSGGLATIRGRGDADVSGCRAENSKVLALVASVLQVPELANPDFDTCHVEFSQAGSRIATPVLRLLGEAVRLSGHGTVDLDSYGLDYELSLALAPKLLAKVTRPELRGAFEKGADGFSAISFRLYGTTLDPKTDLLARLGKAAATSVAKDQLNKLFKKKSF